MQIEREIENLCDMGKFDNFLNVANLYHVKRCRENNCGTYNFICNLRYLYIENLLNKTLDVENFKKYCRNNHDLFYVIITFLHTISDIEKEKIKLEIKLKKTIELWSANTAQK